MQDKREGKGKLFFADGTVYEGDFVNDCFHGYGVMTYHNGDKY